MEATSGKRPFLASPRRQRQLLLVALALLAVGVGALTFVLFRNTGDTTETFSTEPANIFKPEKTVTVDPAARRVAGMFIKTAVARKSLAASYDLVHPDLRQGMTRKQWATGNIPIVYYPTGDLQIASFKVETSVKDNVVLQVFMVPKVGSKAEPVIFFIGLKRTAGQPWQVYMWEPRYTPAIPDAG